MPSPHWRSPGVPFLMQFRLQFVATLRQSVRPAAYMTLAARMHKRFPGFMHTARCPSYATLYGTLHACPSSLHCFLHGMA